MTERPILFSAPMVLALLAGTKTQTRRILKADHLEQVDRFEFCPERGEWEMGETHQGPVASVGFVRCPYGEPGDRLWVKETWATGGGLDEMRPRDLPHDSAIIYAADNRMRSPTRKPGRVLKTANDRVAIGKGRPSIFMMRWMSRLLLEVTDVRVERLQDITEADAKAEGVKPVVYSPEGDCWTATEAARTTPHRVAYEYLWNEINGWHPNSWDANPWVWVVDFKKV